MERGVGWWGGDRKNAATYEIQLTFVIDVGRYVHGAGVGVEVEVGATKLPHLVGGEVVDGAFDLGLVLAFS